MAINGMDFINDLITLCNQDEEFKRLLLGSPRKFLDEGYDGVSFEEIPFRALLFIGRFAGGGQTDFEQHCQFWLTQAPFMRPRRP